MIAAHERRRAVYVSTLDSAAQHANRALDDLAAGSERDAHWWVGYLESTLETLLATVERDRGAS